MDQNIIDYNCTINYIILSSNVFSIAVLCGPKINKKKKLEYTHQILGGNDVEPPNYEKHNFMQIVISFEDLKQVINFIFCYIMYLVQIWQKWNLSSNFV